jgi:cytochrome d ubiquinol oxidase subunit II
LVLPIAAVSSLFAVRILLAKDKAAGAFAASCIMILMVAFTGIAGLFPNLIPSNLDPLYSLTIYNSSSSRLTLTIMTAVALIIVPVVISYKIWVYRIFSRRLTTDDLMEEEGY